MNLEGFLTNTDVNTIKLTKDNVFLEYDDPNVGENKPIHIDPRYPRSCFGLEGTNSGNYVISKDSMLNDTTIVGTILPRPLNVRFYTVIKEYDGSPVFDKKYLRYSICKTSDSASGLVTGTDSTVKHLRLIKADLVNPPRVLRSNIDATNIEAVYAVSGYTENYHSQKIKDASQEGLVEPSVKIKYDADEGVFVGEVNTDYEETKNWNLMSFPVCHEGPVFTTTITEPAFPADVTTLDGSLVNVNNYSTPISYNVAFQSGHDADAIRQPGWEMEIKEELVTDKVYIKDSQSEVNGSDTQPEGKRFTSSDVGCVLVDVDNAVMPNKNITETPTPLTFTNIHLTSGVDPAGRDASGNYRIQSVEGYGQIYKRVTDVSIKGKSKVYDGTCNLEYNLDSVSRLVNNDDIQLDPSLVLAKFESKAVGSSAIVVAESKYNLIGEDSKNYEVRNTFLVNESEISITPRPVTAAVNELRVYRTSGKLEINYELTNSLSPDDIYLDFSDAVVTCGEVVIENAFTSADHIDPAAIIHLTSSNNVKLNDGNDEWSSKNTVSDNVNATITGFKLSGSDSSNYILTTDAFINIPIRIIQIH